MFEFLPVLVSNLFFGLSVVMTKTTINQSGRYKAIVYMYVFLSLILFAGAILLGLPLSFPQELLVPYVAQIIIGAAAVISFFKAIEDGKVAILSPLSNIYVLIVILIGATFLSESISLAKFMGMLVILVASLVISFAEVRKLEFEKGVLYIGIAILGWGYYYSLIKIFIASLGPYMSAMFLELGITIAVSAYYLFHRADLSLPTINQSKYILSRSSLVYLGTILNNVSITIVGVILTAGVAAAQPLFDVVFSYFILNERLSIRKYAAVLIMVIGLLVVLLA